MSGWYLTRARLRRDAPAAALAPILLPADGDQRTGNAHRLIWTLFADGPNRRRDFLWREESRTDLAPGRASFLVLSDRAPSDAHQLFELDTPKEFAPALAVGDRLAFSLRANPVVTRRDAADTPRRHDVVMDRLRSIATDARAGHRHAVMVEAGRAWLVEQGARNGFSLLGEPSVDGYEQRRLERPGQRPARFAVLDLDGVIEVREPSLFLDALRRGFGKAKAWGCGLMLIRRVP